MQFDAYQTLARRTSGNYTSNTDMLLNGAMGLNGEAGEFIDLLKKHMFQGHEFDPLKCALELGDILWYLSLAADAIGYPLDVIAQMNIDKLKARYPVKFDPAKSINRVD